MNQVWFMKPKESLLGGSSKIFRTFFVFLVEKQNKTQMWYCPSTFPVVIQTMDPVCIAVAAIMKT